jgi:RimJ/RimL family protein N-acetyltransferase
VVEAGTDPRNAAMQAVFQRVGWEPTGSLVELGREWLVYRITRKQWQARRDAGS